MMRVARNELPKTIETSETVIHAATWGDMHVKFNVFKEKFDISPLLKGLPGNLDPCPRWGIVVKGQMHIAHDGTEEIAREGDAYYVPPGCRVLAEAGTEVWEFGPADKMEQTLKVVRSNVEEAQRKKLEQQNRLYSVFFPNFPAVDIGGSKNL